MREFAFGVGEDDNAGPQGLVYFSYLPFGLNNKVYHNKKFRTRSSFESPPMKPFEERRLPLAKKLAPPHDFVLSVSILRRARRMIDDNLYLNMWVPAHSPTQVLGLGGRGCTPGPNGQSINDVCAEGGGGVNKIVDKVREVW